MADLGIGRSLGFWLVLLGCTDARTIGEGALAGGAAGEAMSEAGASGMTDDGSGDAGQGEPNAGSSGVAEGGSGVGGHGNSPPDQGGVTAGGSSASGGRAQGGAGTGGSSSPGEGGRAQGGTDEPRSGSGGRLEPSGGAAGHAATETGGFEQGGTSGGALGEGGGLEEGGAGGQGQGPEIPERFASLMDQCWLASNAQPTSDYLSLPAELTEVPWSIRESICLEGGFDLSRCAGKEVTWVSVESTTYSLLDIAIVYTANLLFSEEEVCCVYLTDSSAPGDGFSPSCGAVYDDVPAEFQPAMDQCNLVTEQLPTTEVISIPESLTDAQWGSRDSACRQGGFDLSRCAGKTVTMVTVEDTVDVTRDAVQPDTAYLLFDEGNLCCAYFARATTVGGGTPIECGPAHRPLYYTRACDVPIADDPAWWYVSMSVPTVLEGNDFWTAVAPLCEEGGYTLSNCGSAVGTLLTVPEVVEAGSEPVELSVMVSASGELCCLWEEVGEVATLRARDCEYF